MRRFFSIFFLIFLLFSSVSLKAQFEKGQGFSSTSLGIMFDKIKQKSSGLPSQNLNVAITPDFGFCLSKNFTMSLRLNFAYQQHKETFRYNYGYGGNTDEEYSYTQYSIGPGVSFRYYKVFKSNFGFFVQMNFDGRAIRRKETDVIPNRADTTDLNKGWGMSFTFIPGIVYFPRPLIAVYATYGAFGYAYSSVWQVDSPNLPETTHQVVFEYMPSSFRVGMTFFFRKKKIASAPGGVPGP